MADLLRLMDANLNRASEAARVLEDAARFLLDHAELAGGFKRLRHELAAAALAMAPGLELHRRTPGDVGRSIKTAPELTRRSVGEVAQAAGARLGQALRCIEEYGKLLNPQAAAAVEKLRYQGYELHRRLIQALGADNIAGGQWKLCVLLTERLCEHLSWREMARACLEAGADCLQLREKELEGGELLDRACWLVELARRCGPKTRRPAIIINDRPDVALLADSDGVHLGQTDLPLSQTRKLAARRLLIGLSTTNLAQARAAIKGGADYVGLGPMFPTTTKHKPRLAGPQYAAAFLKLHPDFPHLAIGGVTVKNIPLLAAAGVRGVAVSQGICGDPQPAKVVRKMLKALLG